MIKEENRQAITQKDELLEQMVNKTYKDMRGQGQFQTVYQIFSKLPISRIEKEEYQFLFDSVRQNVAELVNRQDQVQRMMVREQELIAKIEVKVYRDKAKDRQKGRNGELQPSTVTLTNYDFANLPQLLIGEKLASGKPIFKSVAFMRTQVYNVKERVGEMAPFQPDQQYLNLKEIKNEIGDIRMFYNHEEQLKRYQFEFADENRVEFRSRNFPSSFELQQRAQILAKLYLLHLYRQQGRKAKQIYKTNEIQQNKQRQIRKIKQELDVQKIKQGEMIEEMDLIKQVYKILMLIERKMNQLAFNQFQQKNGDKATQIKRSLEKLKAKVNEEASAKNKLKFLITYKHKKGW